MELRVRGIYKIRSRNLRIGVYVKEVYWAEQRFGWYIGIREKFGNRYLSSEYGWNPSEYLGQVPENIELTEGKAEGKYFVGNKPLFELLEALENG